MGRATTVKSAQIYTTILYNILLITSYNNHATNFLGLHNFTKSHVTILQPPDCLLPTRILLKKPQVSCQNTNLEVGILIVSHALSCPLTSTVHLFTMLHTTWPIRLSCVGCPIAAPCHCTNLSSHFWTMSARYTYHNFVLRVCYPSARRTFIWPNSRVTRIRKSIPGRNALPLYQPFISLPHITTIATLCCESATYLPNGLLHDLTLVSPASVALFPVACP